MIPTWRTSIVAFFDKCILVIFFFGFSSGLPFLLTLSTLTLWLKELGVSHTTLGLFVLVTLPYTLKFLWGPFVDHLRIPFLTPLLGQRRSWALFSQVCLLGMILGLGMSQPKMHLLPTALWALGTAFFSAIQDIVLEAYRIEMVAPAQRGAAATATVLGWRLGLITSGVGALFLAEFFSWEIAYAVMACLMGVGVLTTLWSSSPPQKGTLPPLPSSSHKILPAGVLLRWLLDTYLPPLTELWRLHNWPIVVAFIFLYKIGDTSLNVMSTPFLVDIGFSKLDIAHIAKLFGISAMVIGGLIGGVFLNRFRLFLCLTVCVLLQILSSFMFMAQALVGPSLGILTLTIGLENVTCGFGTTVFLAYLSRLCSAPHTATHFALLSSLGSLARIVISLMTGLLADLLTWPLFFGLTALLCTPSFFLLFCAPHYFSSTPPSLKRKSL